VALCVHPDYDYVVVRFHDDKTAKHEYLVLAEGLLAANGLEAEAVVARVKGRDLAGMPYEKLFDYDVPDIRRPTPDEVDRKFVVPDDWQGSNTEYLLHMLAAERARNGWKVVLDEYVTLEDGTGVVHLAPAFGEDDYRIGLREKLPFLNAIDPQGCAVDSVALAPGKWFKEVDQPVMNSLKRRGLLFLTEMYEHNYPHCYRTDAPLISYPLDSWFIKVTEVKDELIKNNQKIMWVPDHIRDGRFRDWLNNVIDWSLSRDRFWGMPLPVWTCPVCGHQECLGSYAELKEKCPDKFAGVTDVYDQSQFNPHRPYIDEYTWACPKCGGLMQRERYVIDPWFDAGAMPFCQMHYPFENQDQVDGDPTHGQFPADFISEAVDQTRGWFYTLHTIAALIKQEVAYKRCLVFGHITDEQGRKMSKSKGNVVDPWEVLENHGADAFRWYFYSGGSLFAGARFSEAGVVEALQRFIIPLWNVYSFFTIYANIDGFDPSKHQVPWERLNELDKWILIKLNRVVSGAAEYLEKLALTDAAKCFEELLDCLTNWYVRRSRRRFWQAECDDAKWGAYHTLYTVLATLTKALAPFTPFIAEHLYQQLLLPFEADAPVSVHLCAYPEPEALLADEKLEYGMDQARRVTRLGRAARKESGRRVRQPLSSITLVTTNERLKTAVESHLPIILEELNVKAVCWAEDEQQFVSYRYKPNFKKLGPMFGKDAPQVAKWIEEHGDEITKQHAQHQDLEELRWMKSERGTFDHNWVSVTLDGGQVDVTEDCYESYLVEKEETIAQRDGNLLLVLDTRVTPELRLEGLAREVVNRVQNRRKALNLDYTDRINVSYQAPEELQRAVEAHLEYITHETLALSFEPAASLTGDVEESKIDGLEFLFAIEKPQS